MFISFSADCCSCLDLLCTHSQSQIYILLGPAVLALAEPLSTHFTHFTHCHRQPISPISLTYRVAGIAASRLGLAASQLDLAAAQLVVLSVGFRSLRELGKFYAVFEIDYT